MQKLNKKRNPIAKQLRHYKNKITKKIKNYMTAKNNSKFYTTRKKYNWSRKYYKNLTEFQHNINNIWFYNTLKQLKDNGFLYVPILIKNLISKDRK